MILVARFELTKACAAQALLMTSRLMLLIHLLGYDRLDRAANGTEDDRFAAHVPRLNNPAELQNARRTFWVAFLLHCHGVANAGGPNIVETDEVCFQ